MEVKVKEAKVEMENSIDKDIGVEKSMMRCTSNFEDHSFYNVDDDLSVDRCGVSVSVDACVKKEVEEDEVDILGFNGSNEIQVSKCDDGTDEYSSSFSGTLSEHGTEAGLNDQEADSMISNNDTSLPFWVRKKKLADHWRRFIQPITWRSKWLELKVKEFEKQALKYDKEIEKSCQAKQLELENLKSKEHGVKVSSPLPYYTQKNRLKKRKKRKRVEETSDVPSFALNHNLFSYEECRKSFADAFNDNSRNLDKLNKSTKDETVFCEEPLLELREGDAYLEQILLKIEAAKSEARNLKIRVDKVLSENPCSFSPVITLNLLGSADALTISEQPKPQVVIKNQDEEPIVSEEKPVESASISSPDDTPEDDETTDILLSEILASSLREGKAVVPNKKLKKTEQASVEEGPSRASVEAGPSRPARKRTLRNREVRTREETKPKRQRVSREKPKSNVVMASRYTRPNRNRQRGKRRSGSAGSRRRS